MSKPDPLKALRMLCDMIVETVGEFPNGAPAGPMYMAFAEHGVTLEIFENIMNALVTAGRLRKSGHQYFPAKQ